MLASFYLHAHVIVVAAVGGCCSMYGDSCCLDECRNLLRICLPAWMTDFVCMCVNEDATLKVGSGSFC